MSLAQMKALVARHRWALAFMAVMFFGYQLGKDAAMRDNARDRIEQAGGRT